MAVARKDLLGIAQQVIKELGLTQTYGVELTYVAKVGREWRANFSFKKSFSDPTQTGCFSVDSLNGEVTFVALRREWQ